MVDHQYNARRIRRNVFFVCGARSAVVSPQTEVAAIVSLPTNNTGSPPYETRPCWYCQPPKDGVRGRFVSLFRNIWSHITKKYRRSVPAIDGKANEDNVACQISPVLVQRPILKNVCNEELLRKGHFSLPDDAISLTSLDSFDSICFREDDT